MKKKSLVETNGKWHDEDGNEVIEDGGKWYDEDLHEIVFEKEPVSYGMFTEGQEYGPNYFGTFKVLEIMLRSKDMRVQYVTSNNRGVCVGECKVYPMSAQSEAIASEAKRKKTALQLDGIADFSGSKQFFTLGAIASSGYVSAEIGPKSHKSFPQKYLEMTGESVEQFDGKGYHLSPNDDRWSYTLRVHLPSLSSDFLNNMSLPNVKCRSEGIEVNDNSFVWGLFNLGFSFGRNNEKASEIASKLGEADRSAFWSGFEVMTKMAA